MQYTNAELMRLQQILDAADPYLVEHFIAKDEDELLEQLERLEREKDVIPNNAQEWLRRHQHTIDVARAMYQVKKINKGDPKGGLIIL